MAHLATVSETLQGVDGHPVAVKPTGRLPQAEEVRRQSTDCGTGATTKSSQYGDRSQVCAIGVDRGFMNYPLPLGKVKNHLGQSMAEHQASHVEGVNSVNCSRVGGSYQPRTSHHLRPKGPNAR